MLNSAEKAPSAPAANPIATIFQNRSGTAKVAIHPRIITTLLILTTARLPSLSAKNRMLKQTMVEMRRTSAFPIVLSSALSQ
jgi:hypothetical protein